MKIFQLKLFAVLLLLVSIRAQAQITGLTSYAGNGCPEGSVHSSVTDDGGIISFLFDEFTGNTSSTELFVSRRCLLNVSVNVPEGFRISTIKAAQNGFVSVPQGSYAGLFTQIDATDFKLFAVSGHELRYFTKPVQDNVSLEVTAVNRLRAGDRCPARSERMAIRSQLFLATSPRATEFAGGAIDSIDASLQTRNPSSVEVFFEKCPNGRKTIPKVDRGVGALTQLVH